MIISRTPLRMSFAGGGSDLPAFYRHHPDGGAVLSTAIDKYIYVSVNRKFDDGIRLAYSRVEEVDRVDQVEHRLVRAVLEMLEVRGGVEITSTADIPAHGTGLGSSSAFTVGLIQALSGYLGRHVSADELAERACHIELERCGEPIGKQDQYAAAHGGLNFIEFLPDGAVRTSPVIMPHESRARLQERLLLLYTGVTRSASGILKQQSAEMEQNSGKRASVSRLVRLAHDLRRHLQEGNVDAVGHTLDESWSLKRRLTEGVTTDFFNEAYLRAQEAGAIGGKLLGAGAGGFFLFYAPADRHLAIREATGMRVVRTQFDPGGSNVLFCSPEMLIEPSHVAQRGLLL